MENLVHLINHMQDNDWKIHAFFFNFGRVRSVVSVETTDCFKPHNRYTICRLTFFDRDNETRTLQCESSHLYFQTNPTNIRWFFKIEPVGDIQNFLAHFYEQFNRAVPPEVRVNNDPEIETCIGRTYTSHGENPFRNCYGVIHNGNNGQRTPHNTDKAKRYCLDVYEHFKTDTNISFCFHEGPASTLVEILERLAKKQENLHH